MNQLQCKFFLLLTFIYGQSDKMKKENLTNKYYPIKNPIVHLLLQSKWLTLQVCRVAELFFSRAGGQIAPLLWKGNCAFLKPSAWDPLADALLICDKRLQVENVWEAIHCLRLFKCHKQSIWNFNWKNQGNVKLIFKNTWNKVEKLYLEWKSENIKLV